MLSVPNGRRVWLDVDLDFFVQPRQHQGGQWYPWRSMHTWLNVSALIERLKAKGLHWQGAPACTMPDHSTAYRLWWLEAFAARRRRRRWTGAVCIHVDAHADWYPAYPEMLHCGNFLRKAMEAHLVSEVYWVLPDYLDPLRIEGVTALGGHEVPPANTLRWQDGHLAGEILGCPVHLVTLEDLPAFDQSVSLVTLASSPGYAPPVLEGHLAELCWAFGADVELALAEFRREIEHWRILEALEAPVSEAELEQTVRADAEQAVAELLADEGRGGSALGCSQSPCQT